MITSEEIKRRLWDGANELRGSMDASRYKDYMLGLMFYKFLSDKTLETFKSTAGLGQLSEAELVEEYTRAREEYGVELDKMIQNVLGYYVLPEFLYQTWLKDINSGEFEVQKVTDSLNNFERTLIIMTYPFILYLALFINDKFGINYLLRLFLFNFLIILIISLIMVLFFPSYGVSIGTHEGAWQGMFLHKNAFGFFIFIFSSILLIYFKSFIQNKILLILSKIILSSYFILTMLFQHILGINYANHM